MSEFTRDDVGKTYKDRDGNEWFAVEAKDIVHNVIDGSVSGGDIVWRPLIGAGGEVTTNRFGVLKADERLFEPTVFIAPPAPVRSNRFVEPDIGDVYLDTQINRKWRLAQIREDGVCIWTTCEKNNHDDEWYSDTFGYRTTFHGKRMMPEQWVFNPNEAPVKVSTPPILTTQDVGSEFVDNKGSVWLCHQHSTVTNTYHMIQSGPEASHFFDMWCLPSGFPVENNLPKSWQRRIVAPLEIAADQELVDKAMEVEAGHPDMVLQQQAAERSDAFDPGRAVDGVQHRVSIPSVQSGKTERVKEMIEESKKLTPEEIIEMGEKLFGAGLYGKYPQRSLLPTDALAMVQQLLVDPASLNMHEHLGVRSERFYLAHSVCAQLFRLQRLIQEHD